MSNDKRGAIVHKCVHTTLNDGLGTRVDTGSCFIQDHDGRIGNGCARNGDELSLTLRKRRTVVFKHGVVAVGETTDEIVGTCKLCGTDAVLVSGV